MRVVKHLQGLTKTAMTPSSLKEWWELNFKRRRLLFLLRDLHSSVFRFLLSKVSIIRGKANTGQSQCLALTEHKCFTSGLNYQRITESVALCHSASHTRFKQVENLFKAVVSNQPLPALAKKTHLGVIWDQIHVALEIIVCESFKVWNVFWLISYLK